MFDVLGITAPFAFSPVSSSSPGCRQVLVGLEDPVYSSRAFQQQIPHFRDRHPGFLHGADEAADTGFSVTGRESSDEGFVLIWPTSSGYDSTAVVLCLIWSTSLGGWICPSASPVSDAGAGGSLGANFAVCQNITWRRIWTEGSFGENRIGRNLSERFTGLRSWCASRSGGGS